MNPLTPTEQNLYNTYLKHSRKGQAWTPRKNFEDLSATIVSPLKKLSLFLSKYPQINWEEYFAAPNVLHPEDRYPTLDTFASRVGIRNYQLYKKHQENQSPESHLDEIKKGLKFIGMFCIKNKIPVEKYLQHKNGLMPSWTMHYREHNISPYCLFELGANDFYNLTEEEQAYWAPDLINTLDILKTRYHQSSKIKGLVQEITHKIKNFVSSELSKSNSQT